VVGVAAASSPRETESDQQLALSTVFTSIGIYNIDTVADDGVYIAPDSFNIYFNNLVISNTTDDAVYCSDSYGRYF
jgi:hypothetical protein